MICRPEETTAKPRRNTNNPMDPFPAYLTKYLNAITDILVISQILEPDV